MRSPCPGMDPYLESPEYFPDFHNSFVTFAQAELQPILPASYFAKKGRRVFLEYVERPIGPDVYISRRTDVRRDHDEPEHVPVATIAETGPVVVVCEPAASVEVETEEPYLEIYTGRGERKRLVTTIEVLSPTIKTSAGEGRAAYVQKQRELMSRDVHMVEIDLLRGGRHTTAVPERLLREKAGPFDYHVCLHCFHDRRRYYVWPIRLEDALPEIAIPLLPDDPVVTLNLQTVFDRSYESGPFPREIEYQNEIPEPPLTDQQARWARIRLESARSV